MVENTRIEWADHTFNPWVGCEKVSPACDHCYAESWAKRIGKPHLWSGKRERTTMATWRKPMEWSQQAVRDGRRYRVFCASLADVFDNAVPPEWRADLLELIRRTPGLDWLLLTKRVGNVARMLAPFVDATDPLAMRSWPNLWIGATVVSQAEAVRDVPKLLALAAKVRFLSIEPLLEPINLRALQMTEEVQLNALTGFFARGGQPTTFLPYTVDWVIAGGESGAHARPMSPAWIRSLREQCKGSRTPFLFKQWGEWAPPDTLEDAGPLRPAHTYVDGYYVIRAGRKAAGRTLDQKVHTEFPA